MADKRVTLVPKQFMVPFALITSLFFLWGLSRSILDVLNKHFQDLMELTKSESALIQAAVYSAYFLMAVPAGLFITKRGYRSGVVLGLLLFALGALLFIPGDMIGSFRFFLVALFVLGCGLAFLETAANPYAAALGDPRTSASRLNLAQAFNGMGCIFGPLIFGQILFREETAATSGQLAVPYAVMGGVVLVVAMVFSRCKLPELKSDDDAAEGAPESKPSIGRLWSHRAFIFGLAAIFFYEIAEISINSFFINYVTEGGRVGAADASALLSVCGLGLFFLGRVIGSGVMSRVGAEKVLLLCSAGAVGCMAVVMLSDGYVAITALCATYLFESIMFPTIFAMSLSGLGGLAKLGSSFLMMSPIGGAIGTLSMGFVADAAGMAWSFAVPLAGFAVVLAFALFSQRRSWRA